MCTFKNLEKKFGKSEKKLKKNEWQPCIQADPGQLDVTHDT